MRWWMWSVPWKTMAEDGSACQRFSQGMRSRSESNLRTVCSTKKLLKVDGEDIEKKEAKEEGGDNNIQIRGGDNNIQIRV
uniref:Uncharacterized protein n=1 Tax=Brassica oleracea TaxID=3712 RepID=A0A3P6DY33_BRAOL|nr:unnamed protein product [Brassica oleracea]